MSEESRASSKPRHHDHDHSHLEMRMTDLHLCLDKCLIPQNPWNLLSQLLRQITLSEILRLPITVLLNLFLVVSILLVFK